MPGQANAKGWNGTHVESPDNPDSQYALCKAKLTLREYDVALNLADSCLAAIEGLQSQDAIPTSSLVSRMHYFAGEALMGTGRVEEAVKRFEMAISADPSDQLPYLSLSRCHAKTGRLDSARHTISGGMAACRETAELHMLARCIEPRPSISACMIVKNEEELLPACLDSIRDWVDEIIVVDTGSTDKTVEIAESFGARVCHHVWEGDFSKARNYSLQYATKDWILVIDADERVPAEDVPIIVRTLVDSSHPIISVNVLNKYEHNRNLTVFLPSVRFFRRELGLQYGGIVHNQLVVPVDGKVYRTGIRIMHLGYGLPADKMAQKKNRTKELLEKQLAVNPDDPFALFNYAQLLRSDSDGFSAENIPIVIASASRAVELTRPDDQVTRHIHLMCLDQLAWAHFFEKKYDTAVQYCRRALEIKPDYLDPMLLLGHIYTQQADFQSAIQAFQRYLTAREKYDPAREADNIILLHLNSQAIAYYSMAMVSELAHDPASAKEYYRRTLALDPNYLAANENLGRLLLAEESYEEAQECFMRQLQDGRGSAGAILGLAEIHECRGDFDKAIRQLQLLINQRPGSTEIFIRLGRLCLLCGDDQEAEDWFERAEAGDEGGVNTLRLIAEAWQNAGHHGRAAEIYGRLVASADASADLLNDLGNCYFRMGDNESAQTHYRKALTLEPTFAPAWRNLGLTLARMNQPREAADLLEKYLAVNPEPTLVEILADLHVSAGTPDRAIPLYEQHLQAHPGDLAALYRLSECYLVMGHKDAALIGLKNVVKFDPDYAPAALRIQELESSRQVPLPAPQS